MIDKFDKTAPVYNSKIFNLFVTPHTANKN